MRSLFHCDGPAPSQRQDSGWACPRLRAPEAHRSLKEAEHLTYLLSCREAVLGPRSFPCSSASGKVGNECTALPLSSSFKKHQAEAQWPGLAAAVTLPSLWPLPGCSHFGASTALLASLSLSPLAWALHQDSEAVTHPYNPLHLPSFRNPPGARPGWWSLVVRAAIKASG